MPQQAERWIASLTLSGTNATRLLPTMTWRELLLQRNREPAQIRIRHQPGLLAGEFEHGALLVGQHDRARAAADGEARARRAIDAGDVGGTVDVADAAAQHRLRTAEHQA